MSRLLKIYPLTFQRYDEVNGGYLDANNNYVSGGRTPVITEGNLQPYRMGTTQLTLPEGYKAEESLIYYTKTEIKTVEQFGKSEADETTIDGFEYVAHASGNWNRYSGLRLNHYKILLVRKDLPTNGGL